jgi:hypothetical protein
MDAARFDALARSIDMLAPRRAAIGALGGGLAALLARFGIDNIEAKKKGKKKKKKCKGKKKKCGKKCIPKANCCKDSNCGPDQTCVSGTCTCPEGLIPCGAECIEDFQCCVDADCGGDILTCEDNVCTCPDPIDLPCDVDQCCDVSEDQVCDIQTGACLSGCPTTDFCSDESLFFCDFECFCVTSVEAANVCTDLFGECFECATDAECTTELGQDAVCISNGEFCTGCDGFTTICIATGCPSGLAERRSDGRPGRIRSDKQKFLR